MSVRDTKPNTQSSFCEKTMVNSTLLANPYKDLPRDVQGRHLLVKRLVTDEREICNYIKNT